MKTILRSSLLICVIVTFLGFSDESTWASSVPPTIVTQPQGSTNRVGDTVTLSVNALGSDLRYQWRRNGIVLADSSTNRIQGSQSPTLTIHGATGEDSGDYTVTVWNVEQAVLSPKAVVVVLLTATINTPPVFLELVSGTNLVLSIDVHGPGPFNYLLRRDSVDLITVVSNVVTTFNPNVFTSIKQRPDDMESFVIEFTLLDLTTTDSGIYRLGIDGPGGTTQPTEIASLVILAQPAITVRPQSQIVYEHDNFTLTVSASGTLPMFFQWLKDGTPMKGDLRTSGTLTPTLSVLDSTNSDSGIYELSISNKAGIALSPPASVKVIKNISTWVNYDFPELFNPGQTNLVTILATPPPGTKTYAIEDLPPSGWVGTATNFITEPPGQSTSSSGQLDALAGKVKFGPFYDDTPRTLRYMITPPRNSTDRVLFELAGSADGSDTLQYKIVMPNVPHPADTNADYALGFFRMEVNEVTAYAAAWLKGTSWPLPPTNVPANYVTRAGALWRNGSDYILDPNAGAAPLYWVNRSTAPRAGRMSAPVVSSAVRVISGLNATLTVQLAADATVYAVEESLPPGFSANAITEGGSLDAIHNQIKWGPFFDNQTRILQYKLHPPSPLFNPIEVSGIVSIDGSDLEISGDKSFSGTVVIEEAQLELEKFPGLIISGTLGARYLIQSADSLSPAQWLLLDTITLTNSPQYWLDGRSPFIQTERYYRAVIVPQ
jgi:hypothetical protein